jgi:N-acetyl-gamma-glutamyl-phosphate reductase
MTSEEVLQIYNETYKNEAFIRIHAADVLPQTKQVVGSNFCDIGLQVDQRTNRLIVISAIDNLIKGASGQAVQNMNLMLGFPETMSLENLIPRYP